VLPLELPGTGGGEAQQQGSPNSATISSSPAVALAAAELVPFGTPAGSSSSLLQFPMRKEPSWQSQVPEAGRPKSSSSKEAMRPPIKIQRRTQQLLPVVLREKDEDEGYQRIHTTTAFHDRLQAMGLLDRPVPLPTATSTTTTASVNTTLTTTAAVAATTTPEKTNDNYDNHRSDNDNDDNGGDEDTLGLGASEKEQLFHYASSVFDGEGEGEGEEGDSSVSSVGRSVDKRGGRNGGNNNSDDDMNCNNDINDDQGSPQRPVRAMPSFTSSFSHSSAASTVRLSTGRSLPGSPIAARDESVRRLRLRPSEGIARSLRPAPLNTRGADESHLRGKQPTTSQHPQQPLSPLSMGGRSRASPPRGGGARHHEQGPWQQQQQILQRQSSRVGTASRRRRTVRLPPPPQSVTMARSPSGASSTRTAIWVQGDGTVVTSTTTYYHHQHQPHRHHGNDDDDDLSSLPQQKEDTPLRTSAATDPSGQQKDSWRSSTQRRGNGEKNSKE
jgi:hypothetical protein